MKKLSLTTTALYIALASAAFADSNSVIVTQASVGAGAPSLNFTQSGSGATANIIQNGGNTLTGVQVGTGGTVLNADQENPTAGAANTINYTGRSNSVVTINQLANNGIFNAGASVGNTANVDLQGNLAGTNPNKLTITQVGYNNTATVNDAYAGYAPIPTLIDTTNVIQYSDNANAGNQLQIISNKPSAGENVNVLQNGGNKANINIVGGQQGITLTQTNTAKNTASANVANLRINGAGFTFTQTGTLNDIETNLNGTTTNAGLVGFQNGTGNYANITQNISYQDGNVGANVVDQTGNNNIAVATQTNTHNSKFSIIQNGNANNALINQGGTSNTALIQQTGNNNQGTINQTGTSNTAQIIQATNNNVATITQNGTGLTTVIHQ